MTDTTTTQQPDTQPKHALRRHLIGRDRSGLIPVATLIKGHQLQGPSHSHSDPAAAESPVTAT